MSTPVSKLRRLAQSRKDQAADAERSERARVKQQAERAKRAARRARQELGEQASEAASEARADARETGQRAARGAGAALLGSVTNTRPTGSVQAPRSAQEIAERAGDAAQLRAPMQATLDPGADGPALERFAAAEPMPEPGDAVGTQRRAPADVDGGAEGAQPARQRPRDGASLPPGFVGLGGEPPRTDATDQPNSPLEFADPMDVLGPGGEP